MKIIHRPAIPMAVLSLCLMAPLAQGQERALSRVAPATVGVRPEGLDGVTSVLETAVAEGRIAGAVAAVARDGSLVYLESVGQQDIASGRPMSERSLFRIYSMSKAVTAVAVMMLVEEGKIGLDEPVETYLPDFASVGVRLEGGGVRPPSRKPTIRDLLLHTSGLNHRTSRTYREAAVRDRNDTLAEFIQKIAAEPLEDDPGARYRYSESPTVLGRVVEVVSGRKLDDFLRERIFERLGMVDTGFYVDPARADRLATVYRPGEPGRPLEPVTIEPVPITEPAALLEGAVGLVSTVPDYLRFAQMLLDGGELDGNRLLRAETVASMTISGLGPEALATRADGTGWGLGNVSVEIAPAASNPGRFGWNGSAGTTFWVDPGTRTVAVLMTQSSPADPGALNRHFSEMVDQAIIR